MADTYTEGIRKGFVASGRGYKSKKTVQIRYHIGFERMIRMAVENFRKLGLEPVISRAAVGTVNRAAARTNGYHGTPANRQYDYDHRYDNAIYMDKAFKEKKAVRTLRWRMRNAVLWQRLMRDRQSLRTFWEEDSHLRIKRRRLP